MIAKNLLPAILALVLLMIPCIASAQASKEGVDLRIALNYAHIFYEQSVQDSGQLESAEELNNDLLGFGGSVSIGYKWGYAGLYIDQDLDGVKPIDKCWCIGYQFEDKWYFLGGTYLVARVSPPITEHFELDLGFGAGVMYSNGDDLNPGASYPIIVNDDGKASVALSFKASASFTAYFTDIFGMGLFFDYTVGLNKMKYVAEACEFVRTIKMNNVVHFLKPGLHFRMRF